MPQRPSLVQMRSERERFASSYAAAAVLQAELAERLLERLDYIKLNPQRLLELGAANGTLSDRLKQYYPQAQLYLSDSSLGLLQQQTKDERKSLILCEQEAIALADESMDLIISNLSLAALAELQNCFQELYRLLKPGGLLLFVTLGPDTLQELRYAFQALDQYAHGYEFIDMHHVGDALLAGGWQDPVMDMELITLSYEKLNDLFQDVRHCGARNLLSERNPFLMPKGRWQKMQERYKELCFEDGQFPASFEIIYGHAWKPAFSKQKMNEQNEVLIAIDSIQRKGA